MEKNVEGTAAGKWDGPRAAATSLHGIFIRR